MEELDEFHDPVSEYHVITLVVNTDKSAPELDIGDIPPQAAITFLEQAASCLREVLHPPRITYDHVVIYDVCGHDDDDD